MPSTFFISYNSSDKIWAEWIAWFLEENGSKVVIEAWDFRPGGNLILDRQDAIQKSDQIIIVLSRKYLDIEISNPEWTAIFTKDPKGKQRKVIPVRIEECEPTGFIGNIYYLDLVGLNESDAKKSILDGFLERSKPEFEPLFPGKFVCQTEKRVPIFPRAGRAEAENEFSTIINWISKKTDYIENLDPCYDHFIERKIKDGSKGSADITDTELQVLELIYTYCRLYISRKSLLYSPKFKDFSSEDFLNSMRDISKSAQKIRLTGTRLSSLIKTPCMAKIIESMEEL